MNKEKLNKTIEELTKTKSTSQDPEIYLATQALIKHYQSELKALDNPDRYKKLFDILKTIGIDVIDLDSKFCLAIDVSKVRETFGVEMPERGQRLIDNIKLFKEKTSINNQEIKESQNGTELCKEEFLLKNRAVTVMHYSLEDLVRIFNNSYKRPDTKSFLGEKI